MKDILVIDIGGTYSRFAILDQKGQLNHLEAFINFEHPTFQSVFNAYFNQHEAKLVNTQHCCIAVAGPVKNGIAKLTNLTWLLNANTLQNTLPFEQVELINDFHALGYCVPTLSSQCISTLQTGKPKPQSIKIILGAGTGLGVAIIKQDKHHAEVFPSEGGHADFAPANEQQMRLFRFINIKHKHVSVEHLLSGRGIERIFEFICTDKASNYSHVEFCSEKHASDEITGCKIIRLATEDKDPAAIAAIELFCDIYAAHIGNIALLTLPFGGIYITGGIAKHIWPFLQSKRFVKTYKAKGKMTSLLDDIPIYYIKNKHANLIGAGNYCRQINKAKHTIQA